MYEHVGLPELISLIQDLVCIQVLSPPNRWRLYFCIEFSGKEHLPLHIIICHYTWTQSPVLPSYPMCWCNQLQPCLFNHSLHFWIIGNLPPPFFQHLDFLFPALWCLSTLYWPPSVCMFAIYKLCMCVCVRVCAHLSCGTMWSALVEVDQR